MPNRDTNNINNHSTRMRKQSSNSNSNSPTITSTDPASRLHTLLRTILSVLTNYSTQPGASPIHLTALTQFHQRAVDLDLSPPSPHNHFSPMPHRNGSHSQNGSNLSPPKDLISSTSFLNLDPEAIMEGSPSPPRPGRSKPTPNSVPVPNDIGETSDQQRPALSVAQPSISQEQEQDVTRSPSVEDVDQLEKNGGIVK